MIMKYKVASLFAGVGGICLGIASARTNDSSFNLEWANEIDEYAGETYRINFSHKLFCCDINSILFPNKSNDVKYFSSLKEFIGEQPIDLLNGGFPCQAFSIAGYQKGFDDDRGNLFWAVINTVKLISEKHNKPRVLFLENVKNLMSHDHGNTYKVIKSEIEKLGYVVKEHVLNTMYFSDLPQNRERIYIVCFRDKKDADKFTLFDNLENYKKTFSKEERAEQVKRIIDYSKKVDDKYYYTKAKYPKYFLTKEEYESIPSNERNDVRINLTEDITELYQFYQVRRGMYVRKNKNNVCPTLTANMGTGGHNVPLILDNFGIRKLTPEETFRLQGFPVGNGYNLPTQINGKRYPDSYLYKQAGNAVSVPVIRFIATEILKVIEENDNENNKQYS